MPMPADRGLSSPPSSASKAETSFTLASFSMRPKCVIRPAQEREDGSKKSPQVSQQSHSTARVKKDVPRLRDPPSWLLLEGDRFTHLRVHLFYHPCTHSCPTLSLSLLLPGITKRGFAAAQWTNSMAGRGSKKAAARCGLYPQTGKMRLAKLVEMFISDINRSR